jgi:hypothetical protein
MAVAACECPQEHANKTADKTATEAETVWPAPVFLVHPEG